MTALFPAITPRLNGFRQLDIEPDSLGVRVGMTWPAGEGRSIKLSQPEVVALVEALLAATQLTGADVRRIFDAAEAVAQCKVVDGRALELGAAACTCGSVHVTIVQPAESRQRAQALVELAPAFRLEQGQLVDDPVELALGPSVELIDQRATYLECDVCGRRWEFDRSVPVIECVETKESFSRGT